MNIIFINHLLYKFVISTVAKRNGEILYCLNNKRSLDYVTLRSRWQKLLIFIIHSMNSQVIWLFLFAILSGTTMGISQKFLAGYSPLLVNAIAQAVASVVFFVLYMIFKGTGSGFQFHRAMIVLALAFVGLNYGYSALYGQWVMLAYVPIIVTGGMTVLLGLAGWLWFGEQISWQFIVGALMILAGMGVMVMR